EFGALILAAVLFVSGFVWLVWPQEMVLFNPTRSSVSQQAPFTRSRRLSRRFGASLRCCSAWDLGRWHFIAEEICSEGNFECAWRSRSLLYSEKLRLSSGRGRDDVWVRRVGNSRPETRY